MKRLLRLICATVALVMGCAPYYYDPYYYDYAYYDPYYYSYDTSYMYGWYDPYGVYYYSAEEQAQTSTIDLVVAARVIAERAPSYYAPSGCVTASATGTTVTESYSGCTGRFGGRTISGTVSVTLSQSEGQLIFTASSSNLTIDGNPFNIDFTAAGTAAGTQRVVTVDSRSRAPDQVDSRRTTGTITWTQGDTCVTLNAQGSSSRGTITTTSTIVGYQRCAGQCPTAGTVTVQGPDGAFTAMFNGSGEVKVSGPGGNSKDFDLQCK